MAGQGARMLRPRRWRPARHFRPTVAVSFDDATIRRALAIYRYGSWALTSGVYVLVQPYEQMLWKALAIASLLLAGVMANEAYSKTPPGSTPRYTVMVAEVIGILAFMAITGGADSPFLWYGLNPLLQAGVLMPAAFTWLFMGLYEGALVIMSLLLNGHMEGLMVPLLMFPMAVGGVQVFAQAAYRLAAQRNELRAREAELKLANSRLSRNMEVLAATYQAIGMLSLSAGVEEIVGLFTTQVRVLTHGIKVVFVSDVEEDRLPVGSPFAIKGPRAQYPLEVWMPVLQSVHEEVHARRAPCIRHIPASESMPEAYLVAVPVRSGASDFGLIASLHPQMPDHSEELLSHLQRMAELCAAILERREMDNLMSRLLLYEERNKVAHEIHDGACQELFSVIYGAESLAQRVKELSPDEIRRQVLAIRNTAAEANRDLRGMIYRLSPARQGEEPLVEELRTYVARVQQLNEVAVGLELEGQEAHAPPRVRQTMFRIIREAVSNAIRHGRCRQVTVRLAMQPGTATVEVLDDGQGFDVAAVRQLPRESVGLGLASMDELTRSLGGSLTIVSRPGHGTRVTCILPYNAGEPVPSGEELSNAGNHRGRPSTGPEWV